MIGILKLLNRTQNGCTPEYITLHTNIPEPLLILDDLKKKGYVRNIEPNGISVVQGIKFKLTSKGQKKLEELKGKITYIPIERLVQLFRKKETESPAGALDAPEGENW